MLRTFLDFRFDEGGAGRYGRDLIDAIGGVQDGIEVEVCRGAPPGIPSLLYKRFSPWGRALAERRARLWRADVFHGLHFEIPRTSLSTVVTVQDMRPFEYPDSMSSIKRALFTRLVRNSLRRANRIILTSPLTIDAVEDNGGSKDRIRVIPLGIGPLWGPVSDEERFSARQRWSHGSPYAGAIFHHHFRPHKNFAGFAKMAELMRSKVDAKFLCVGNGETATSNLKFVGKLSDPDLRLFYGGAEVLIVPSIVEGFGYPVLEALACGTPVVAGTRVGALPFVSGAVVEADIMEPEDMAAAVERLLGDPVFRSRLAAKGAELVAPLTIEAMARSTVEVYRELVRTG